MQVRSLRRQIPFSWTRPALSGGGRENPAGPGGIADTVEIGPEAPRPVARDDPRAIPATSPAVLLMEPSAGPLELAREALDYVRSLGIRSSNRGPLSFEERREVDRILEGQARPEVRQEPLPEDAFGVICRFAQAARKYRVGNCGEKSRVAFEFLKKERGLDNLVLVSGESRIRTEDGLPMPHEFLALGLCPQADIARPETWGPDAVILDPWQDFALPVSQGMEYLRGYFDTGYGIDFQLSDGTRGLIPGEDKASDPLLWENLRARVRS